MYEFDRELELIRSGDAALRFNEKCEPVYIDEPIYELKKFVIALAEGYTRLRSQKIMREQIAEKLKKGGK